MVIIQLMQIRDETLSQLCLIAGRNFRLYIVWVCSPYSETETVYLTFYMQLAKFTTLKS